MITAAAKVYAILETGAVALDVKLLIRRRLERETLPAFEKHPEFEFCHHHYNRRTEDRFGRNRSENLVVALTSCRENIAKIANESLFPRAPNMV